MSSMFMWQLRSVDVAAHHAATGRPTASRQRPGSQSPGAVRASRRCSIYGRCSEVLTGTPPPVSPPALNSPLPDPNALKDLADGRLKAKVAKFEQLGRLQP